MKKTYKDHKEGRKRKYIDAKSVFCLTEKEKKIYFFIKCRKHLQN